MRILAIGSSSTQGVGATSPLQSYPARLEAKLREAWSEKAVSVVNAGVGGETADQTLARLELLLSEPAKPDLVLWQVGTNDAVRGGDEAAFEAMVRRGVDLVQQAGIEVILVDQQYFPGIQDIARYERYVRIVAKVGIVKKAVVFSRYAMMRAWNEQAREMLAGMLSSDSFHMSDRGYECLAGALSGGLSKTLGDPAATNTVARERKTIPAVASMRRG